MKASAASVRQADTPSPDTPAPTSRASAGTAVKSRTAATPTGPVEEAPPAAKTAKTAAPPPPANDAAEAPTEAEPAKAEPAKAEPAKAEPAKAEPAKAEPAKAEPAKAEPAKAEPAKAEPAKEAVAARPAPAVAPRPAARHEHFIEGDFVVYPTHGVGKVEKIATEDIAGHRLELIHITFEENRMTLRVPVTKARTAGLRKLASPQKFDEALGVLRGRARVKRTMWSRRAQEYEAKINSGDPIAIAEVVRDLHRNAGQPDQSFSERQIYESAMDRLAAEMAALDATDKTTAAAKLAAVLKTI